MPHIKKITWLEYVQMIDDLASYIERCDECRTYNGVYGIPRGGLIISTIISHKWDIPLITSPAAVCNDKNILVVDDISDAGTTLAQYKEYGNPTACLHINPNTKTIPDYYLRTNEGMWISYPYELEGDTTPQYMLASQTFNISGSNRDSSDWAGLR